MKMAAMSSVPLRSLSGTSSPPPQCVGSDISHDYPQSSLNSQECKKKKTTFTKCSKVTEPFKIRACDNVGSGLWVGSEPSRCFTFCFPLTQSTVVLAVWPRLLYMLPSSSGDWHPVITVQEACPTGGCGSETPSCRSWGEVWELRVGGAPGGHPGGEGAVVGRGGAFFLKQGRS